MKKFIRYFIVFLVVFSLGAFLMYFYMSKHPTTFQEIITKSEKNVKIDDKGISEAVDKVYDSVVTVSTYKKESPYSSGTGFVYKVSGDVAYILTNNHVISEADDIYVTFTDDRKVKAKLVGFDNYSDIAVLSISKEDIIKIAVIGKSDNMKIGDTVFAVGAPLDNAYSWTVTRGVLSGKDRLVTVSQSNGLFSQSSYVMKVLQTDAAINSGNSGGPLANGNGEVVGITSLKLVSSGVEGMGFAIPIEVALKYADKIVAGDEIVYPYLGLSMLDISDAIYYPDFRKTLESLDSESGVLVALVEDSSPASKSSLKKGDVIIEIDGNKCNSVAFLRYSLYSHDVGDKVSIKYLRDGKEGKTSIILGKAKS